MVSFTSTAAYAAMAVLCASGVYADHYITVVNGCPDSRTVEPTLVLTEGIFTGARAVTLTSKGDRTTFKLTNHTAFTGVIYDANSTASDTAGSAMAFQFAASADGVLALAGYVLSNAGGLTIPQIAVSWPSNSGCATKRCYADECPASQAIPVGQGGSAAALTAAASSCTAANTGIDLYYCSSAV